MSNILTPNTDQGNLSKVLKEAQYLHNAHFNG